MVALVASGTPHCSVHPANLDKMSSRLLRNGNASRAARSCSTMLSTAPMYEKRPSKDRFLPW